MIISMRHNDKNFEIQDCEISNDAQSLSINIFYGAIVGNCKK
jgi:hypothetical protein